MTQQATDTEHSDRTVRIPEKIRRPPDFPETPKAQKGSVRKKKISGDSTLVDSLMDRVFCMEEQNVEALSIHANPSLDFRDKLSLLGEKYKIEKVVANGGFGRIMLAEDRILGRKAIVKTLKEEFLSDKKVVEHFIAEAKLSSQLDHPGIVPLFSLDTDSSHGLHLAMQKITGITLKIYLDRCRKIQRKEHLSQKIYNKMLAERLAIFLRICETISYCHSRGILHNDLKPNNIMIGRYGQVYVMDWGLATAEGAEKPKKNVGSPAYMAPERLCSCVLSPQTDIFALGMILNELVTLRTPIDEKSVEKIAERICTGRFEPSSCIDPARSIAAGLRAVIEKARNPNPQERYESVDDLADDIRHFLFHEETIAYPDSPVRKIFRFLFHHRKIGVTLAVCVLFLFAALIGYNFYNAAVIRQKASQKILWRMSLAKSMGDKGSLIGNQLLLLQEQTANMGSALAIEYGKNRYDTNASFYWNEDFAPRSGHRPPGLIHTAAYRGTSISLSTGTFYRFNDQLSRREIQNWANCFHAQQSQYLANVLSHTHNKENAYQTDKMKLFYEQGSTVRRIVFVLDNGLVYSYPGRYEPAASPDAFIPEYAQRELRAGKEFVWSSPYREPGSGCIVVSCWHTIRSMRGNKIGVIGMVVAYEDILEDFAAHIRQDQEPAVYTLIDSESRIIYSTANEFGSTALHADSVTESMIGRHPYKWYPEVIRRIRKNPMQNQFTAYIDRKRFNVSWKQVPSADWLLIQHVPLHAEK